MFSVIWHQKITKLFDNENLMIQTDLQEKMAASIHIYFISFIAKKNKRDIKNLSTK